MFNEDFKVNNYTRKAAVVQSPKAGQVAGGWFWNIVLENSLLLFTRTFQEEETFNFLHRKYQSVHFSKLTQ